MAERDDWNTRIINEFRLNGGRVGGNFEGAPLVLVHHRGCKSGKENIIPMMYLPDENDPAIEVVDAQRDRIYAEQASRYPGFAD